MIDHQRNAVKFLFLLLLCMECNIQFVSAGGDGEVKCIEREREALLRFKQGFIDGDGYLSSWGSEDDKKECCEWMGVQCSSTGHVTGLLLDNYDKSLQGEISSALLELRYLINLDLSRKNFGGNRIPEFIGSMKQLKNLKLFFSNFSGVIPPQLGNLTNLESLDLSENMLEGEIPKSLGNLSHLQNLTLSDNLLGGHLEEVFGDLSTRGMVSLENLYLSYNQLTGSVPDLRACSALRKLFLGSNRFKGSLPVSLTRLSKLEILDVSFNLLQGTISESNFIQLHNLKMLDLSFNSFTMRIAPDWTPPFQLYLVNLASCEMGPDFPKWISTQSSLSWLDVSCGGISDELPKWLWSLFPSLEYLNISNNQISGSIPDSTSIFTRIIDVSSNKFSGPVPLFHPLTEVLQLSHNMFSGSILSMCTISYSKLILLDLSNNQLAGELPHCWEKMKGLWYLNLANNSFLGEIPNALGSLGDLVTLYLRDNNLSGELPSTLKNCQKLKLFNIGGNKLTGNIPEWIGANYPNLAYLSLRHNRLYGSIPSEICNLTRMQILDLAENNLSGKIPECFNNFIPMVEESTTTIPVIAVNIAVTMFMQMPGVDIVKIYEADASVQWKHQESKYRETLLLLKLIDLSSNRLVGSIPGSFSKMKGLKSLNLSRNSLTGNIIPDIGEMRNLESLDLSSNQLSGKIPTGMAKLNFLAVLDLANNNLTGEIPLGTQLQTFDASDYAGNNGLCGRPLPLCFNTSITNDEENIKKDGGILSLSRLQEYCISGVLGFIVGFWGVVGSLVLKKSWRSAYFNLLDAAGDWLYVTIAVSLSKFRR